MSNQSIESKLEALGFGPGRSRDMAQKAPTDLLSKIVSFSERLSSKGFRFRVFQSSGGNTRYCHLRLMVITGSKENRFSDSRHYRGPIEDLEVGALGITHSQLSAISARIDALDEALKDGKWWDSRDGKHDTL